LRLAVERSGRSAHSEDAVVPGLEVSLWERMLSAANLSRALRRVRHPRGLVVKRQLVDLVGCGGPSAMSSS
jgi:hypothetical protein